MKYFKISIRTRKNLRLPEYHWKKIQNCDSLEPRSGGQLGLGDKAPHCQKFSSSKKKKRLFDLGPF
jgi:hypothetical protein